MNGQIPQTLPAAPAPVRTGLSGATSNLARMLAAGHEVIAVEISPPVGPNTEAIQKQINLLRATATSTT